MVLMVFLLLFRVPFTGGYLWRRQWGTRCRLMILTVGRIRCDREDTRLRRLLIIRVVVPPNRRLPLSLTCFLRIPPLFFKLRIGVILVLFMGLIMNGRLFGSNRKFVRVTRLVMGRGRRRRGVTVRLFKFRVTCRRTVGDRNVVCVSRVALSSFSS